MSAILHYIAYSNGAVSISLLLSIVLIAARLLSETVARFGIPSVIGELLIVIALTTMSPPFLLKWFYGREKKIEAEGN